MTAPQLRRVRSGELELAVRLWDNPGQPTLVLVHGYPDNQRVWEPLIAHLTQHFRVVSYDVRGTGESDVPKRMLDYRLDQLAGDLRAVADALCPDQPFHLVAHDWGSIQSWEFVTEPAMQSRIASYTTMSGPCLDHVGFWMRHRLSHPTPRHLGQLLSQLLHSWYIWLFHLPWLMPQLWKQVIARRWPETLKRLEGVVLEEFSATRIQDGYHSIQMYRANMSPRLLFPRRRHTQVPVQLIVPLQDKHVRPQLFDELSRWVAQLWRRDMDTGHWAVLLERTPQLAQYIIEFVDFIESGREPAALAQARICALPEANRISVPDA